MHRPSTTFSGSEDESNTHRSTMPYLSVFAAHTPTTHSYDARSPWWITLNPEQTLFLRLSCCYWNIPNWKKSLFFNSSLLCKAGRPVVIRSYEMFLKQISRKGRAVFLVLFSVCWFSFTWLVSPPGFTRNNSETFFSSYRWRPFHPDRCNGYLEWITNNVQK